MLVKYTAYKASLDPITAAGAAAARHQVIAGDDLLAEKYPTIHACGTQTSI